MTVSRETLLLLASYEDLLRTWSPRINLVSRGDQSTGFQKRHIDDCLSLVEHLPITLTRFIDLGSGGGLPAIPLAIVCGIRADMIESDRRKAAFLQTALATLNLDGAVWRERAETACVPAADCVTARALAPLNHLLELTERLLNPSGTALFLKGPSAQAEIEVATRHWDMTVELLQGSNESSNIVKVTNFRRHKHDLG